MSTPGRFARVKELFDTACDLPRAERKAYLAAQCGDDAELRAEVEKLLSFEDTGDGALGGEHRGAGPAFLAEELAATEFVEGNRPSQIDKYRIIREIGHGGMGIVYEAEQENPRRSVALKVIRSVFATADLYKRFRAEAQLLGRLDHPGIAHIYEAGSAEIAGRSCPFFAMEYIEGQPLDRHVREGKLSQNEILELMALVCDAVSYAHQRGIVHRDLKPANILVKQERESTSTGDASSLTPRMAQPKVLDFGIARVTNSDLQVTTIQTHAGQIVGTLAYMSPEQVAGRGDLDVRCDVYALGVILYEILSGRRPFDLVGKSMAEAARIIEEVESTDLASEGPGIPGDVTTIVAKAMEKSANAATTRRASSAMTCGVTFVASRSSRDRRAPRISCASSPDATAPWCWASVPRSWRWPGDWSLRPPAS
ncbi:MAG: serine/threonine-protein kinase [Candidatus Eisenbacteria bacterium]